MSDRQGMSGTEFICGSAFIVLMTLKIVGVAPVASWSWWWITAPLWIWFAVGAVIIAGLGGVMGVGAAGQGIKQHMRLRRALKNLEKEDV